MDKILIVDDDYQIRSIYKSVLEMEHFDVLEAGNWNDAVPLLTQNRDISVALVDIDMPNFTGDVVHDVIKLHNPDIYIIMFSVYPVDEQRRLVKAADDYFDKADGIDILLRKVRRILQP